MASILYKYILLKLLLASQTPTQAQDFFLKLPSNNYPDTEYIIRTQNFNTGEIVGIVGKNQEMLKSHFNKKVTFTCIKNNVIGMPNISLPNYLGSIVPENTEYSRCYIFLSK